MMKKKIISIITLALLICTLTACQDMSHVIPYETTLPSITESKDSSTEESETPDTVAEFSEEEELELYNLYVEIYNYMNGRMYDSIDRYFTYVAFEEEFSLIGDHYSCYSLSDTQIKKVEDAYTIVSSKNEKTSLDEAFLAMYPSLSTILSTMDSIYDYADLKSYMDDDYARAKEYHAVLWAALAEYATTSMTFMAELDIVAQERMEASLQIMKDEGYIVFYDINMMFNCAGAIQTELYNQGITDENLIEMDLETIQPLYDEFVGYVEEILAYADDSEQLRFEGIPENSAYWHTFLQALKDTKVSLTGIIQRVKDQKPVSSFDLDMSYAFPGDDTIASFNTGIDKMISDYNVFINY
ncbi:MAG: YiiG family protein [Lachnospiraceae bacterium]|nr:YiiG family protein [Lachnospiraceae bacterium]